MIRLLSIFILLVSFPAYSQVIINSFPSAPDANKSLLEQKADQLKDVAPNELPSLLKEINQLHQHQLKKNNSHPPAPVEMLDSIVVSIERDGNPALLNVKQVYEYYPNRGFRKERYRWKNSQWVLETIDSVRYNAQNQIESITYKSFYPNGQSITGGTQTLYFFSPQKDSSIYLAYNLNSNLFDQVLDIRVKEYDAQGWLVAGGISPIILIIPIATLTLAHNSSGWTAKQTFLILLAVSKTDPIIIIIALDASILL